MKIGIEIITTRDAYGRLYWRVAPTLDATQRQRMYVIGLGLIAALAITLSAIAIAATPDPIIKPDQTVILQGWGQ